ncbi:hypothetical protein POM88_041344 [Heracleum sosnowskyi]|uniref:Uncharacterized protein n=1 Tax=Heracleum sosnowskyi TaxID=360622 RepID=A0AAD8HFQ6_9APIA|nr:hypothetical protein POM88_041344 [Heracleum sosnowskyi]
MVSELSTSFMGTDKEQIKNLEAGLQRMETGVLETLKSLEDAISKLSDVVSSKFGLSVYMAGENKKNDFSVDTPDYEQLEVTIDSQPSFVSQTTQLELSKDTSDDSDASYSTAEQFFEYQGMTPTQKTSLAYRLNLLVSSHVHLVFHVTTLKIINGNGKAKSHLPLLDANGLIFTQAESILDTGQHIFMNLEDKVHVQEGGNDRSSDGAAVHGCSELFT